MRNNNNNNSNLLSNWITPNIGNVTLLIINNNNNNDNFSIINLPLQKFNSHKELVR